MKISLTSRCCLALALLTSPAFSQEPAAVRKTVLPSLDSQVAARIVALDARLNPVHSPSLAVGLLGQLASPDLANLAPILADERNNAVWEQLAEDYHRTTVESGDALVTLSETPPRARVAWHSGQVRRLCHERLAKLPRSVLEQYRQRVDAEARALLAQGRQTRSSLPLRRLVDDLFCSSVGDEALDLLGDLAFERGDFDEARHWWRLLAPGDHEHHELLRFPDPKVDLVRVQAKLVLAFFFQGRLDEGRADLAEFRRRYPDAAGALAGQNGVYAKILDKSLATLVQAKIRNNDEPWTTFGGDPTRNRVLSQAPFVPLWEDGPTWRVKLPTLARAGTEPLVERATPLRSLAFHPVIVNQQILIADHRSVISYHLTTGKELFRYDLKTAGLIDPGVGLDAKLLLPRFTLSADQERAYVRLGRHEIGARNLEKAGASYLVCLDLTQPERAKKRELWHIRAGGADKTHAFFEGSPLVRDGRIYIALSKLAGGRTSTSIVCYDTLGRQRWTREVCDIPEFDVDGSSVRQRQHLLTWAAGQIVYCAHAGAIVAVDAWTGQPSWGVRYPSRGPLTADLDPSPRDLAPCLAGEGHVFAAPLDSDRLFCLDAVSGSVRWELEGVEIGHLLGTGHGRLYATTRDGVMAVEVDSGRIAWAQPTDGKLPSLGRGLIAGGWLFWPTRDAQLPGRAVTLSNGRQQREVDVPGEPSYFEPSLLHNLPAGNWAFGQGCLAIAGASELIVYVPSHRLPMEPRPQARIEMLYQQARRHASAGDNAEAIASYQQLVDATKQDRHAEAWRQLIAARLKLLGRKGEAPAESKRPEPSRPKGSAGVSPSRVSLPLVRAWSHDDGRAWHVDADDDRDDCFFCTQPGQVTCRALEDGVQRWRQKLTFEPVWFGRWRDLVVIGGADAVLALRVVDGDAVWTFAAPSRRWRVGSVVAGVPKLANVTAGFVHFSRWDDTLLLLDDHQRFLRLRLDTGEVAWQHASAAATLRPLEVGFAPYAKCVGAKLLAQKVTGQAIWLEKAATPMREPMRMWSQAPALIENRLIVAGEPGRIDALGLSPQGKDLWTFQTPWPRSLTGESCRLIHKDTVLLALVPRNEGPELVRLEPERGVLLWTISARQLADRLDVESICVGDTSFFYVQAGILHARSLNDGTLQWTLPLLGRNVEAQRWRLRYSKHFLAVHPVAKSRDEAFSIGFVDPWEGRWQQRLTFEGGHGVGDVCWSNQRLVVSVAGRIYGFRGLDHE